MSSKLKNLYKYLIRDNIAACVNWHENYKEICIEVQNVKKHIEEYKGEFKFDDDFLKNLIKTKKTNGISSAGQSILSDENYLKLKEDNEFIEKLRNFIKEPTCEKFEEFKKRWNEITTSRNTLLQNRVAAACTLDVSTACDETRFNQVYSWLISEEMLDKAILEKEENDNWFNKNKALTKAIKEEFKDEISNDADETDEYYLNIFVYLIYENMNNPFSLKKQVIKYGPPGTGKTFTSMREAELKYEIWYEKYVKDSNSNFFSIFDQICKIQFHPSYSYEDFIEGLKPYLASNGSVELKLQNGIFKEFCKRASKWEIDLYKCNIEKDFEELTVQDLRPYADNLDGNWEFILNLKDDCLICEAIPPYIFIIDEINRAELSRVFGELMYCLEYRGIKGAIKSQYASLNDEYTGIFNPEKLCYDKNQNYKPDYLFFIPHNLYLIGTMNTIDRSVESIDFAIRRRFLWKEIEPNVEILRSWLRRYNNDKWLSLADGLEKLNEAISKEPLLGKDYQIGHAYLMNLRYNKNIELEVVRKMIWSDFLYPLLYEYFRGTNSSKECIDQLKREFGIHS